MGGGIRLGGGAAVAGAGGLLEPLNQFLGDN